MNAACRQLLNYIDDALDSVDKSLEAPMKVLDAVKDLVDKMGVGDNDWLDALLDKVPDFSTDFVSAIRKMMDCPAIQESEAGPYIAEALDHVDSGEDIPPDLKDKINSKSKEALQKAVDKGSSDKPSGKLNKVSNLYDKALKKAGVNDKLNKAKEYYDCIENLCEGAEEAQEEADKAQKKIDKIEKEGRIGPDGEAEDTVLSDPDVSETAKAEYAKQTKNVEETKNKILDVEWI